MQKALKRIERVKTQLDTPGSRQHLIALVGLLAIGLLLRIVAFQGYSDSDPREYTILADDLARGVFHLGSYDGPAVFSLRTGVYGPTALLIRIFGLSELTIVAYPLLVSIAGCLLAYAVARGFWGPLAGLLGLAVWVVVPLDIRLSSLLYPDAIAAFWGNLAVACLLLALGRTGPRQLAYAVAGGLFLGISWLCKETVVYLAPFLLFLAWTQQRERPLKARAATVLMVAAGGAAVVAIEMALFHFASGDALLRLHGTEENYDQAAIWFFDPSSP
jgi:dolichyl-phosphate-mannose-protein mannosyltransferase